MLHTQRKGIKSMFSYISRTAMVMSLITSYDGETDAFCYEWLEDNKKFDIPSLPPNLSNGYSKKRHPQNERRRYLGHGLLS